MVMETGYAEAESVAKVPKKKPQKSNFIKRWLLKTVKEEVDKERSGNLLVGAQTPIRLSKEAPSQIDNQERSINFTVHVANGGRVIETRRYDRQKDRHSNGLYVITNDQDFGREIDKIITMESLK